MLPNRTIGFLLAVAAALLLTSCGSSPAKGCDQGSTSQRRDCYAKKYDKRIKRDGLKALASIQRETRNKDIGTSCYLLMQQAIGRNYARRHKLTVATLAANFPSVGSPGCAAGFVHGEMLEVFGTAGDVGNDLDEQLCSKLATRLDRYVCTSGLGYVFTQASEGNVEAAIALCSELNRAAVLECVSGVYDEHWLGVVGAEGAVVPDNTSDDVAEYCSQQSAQWVVECWRRGLLEVRPYGYRTKKASDITEHCKDVTGIDRAGCVTASSVIGDPNPLKQFRVCMKLPTADVLDCLHGVKVGNLIGSPRTNYEKLIGRCTWLKGDLRPQCFEHFAQLINAALNGDFAKRCSGLRKASDLAACTKGAARWNDSAELLA
jgi:hypothetical protein